MKRRSLLVGSTLVAALSSILARAKASAPPPVPEPSAVRVSPLAGHVYIVGERAIDQAEVVFAVRLARESAERDFRASMRAGRGRYVPPLRRLS